MNRSNSSSMRTSRSEKPRGWRSGPRPRDFWIWNEVRENGRTCDEVGREVGLTRARVSQICRRLDRWNSSADEMPRREFDGEFHRTIQFLVRLRQLGIRSGHVPPPSRSVEFDVIQWLDVLIGRRAADDGDL